MWIRRHWRALVGAFLLLEPIWRGIKWLITLGGDVDFIVSRSQEPGWVGAVIDTLISPPGWITLPLIVSGLALIYWDTRRSRHALTNVSQPMQGIRNTTLPAESRDNQESPLSPPELQYENPKPNWIPISNAPFALPKMEGIDKSIFYADMYLSMSLVGSTIDKLPNPPGMSFNPSLPTLRDNSGLDLIYCSVEWEKRAFKWTWGDLHSKPPRTHGMVLHPWELDIASHPSRFLDAETWLTLKRKAEFVWSLIQEPMDKMIREGILEVWARHASPTSPFVRVAPDSWEHFKVIDWPRGQAVTKSGERLYSIHVSLSSEIPIASIT
jgi:hypothetical protein